MANKMKTPLLRPLRKNGSTLYMFPSAQEDIGLNINNSAMGAALSSFALLNLNTRNFGFSDINKIALDLQDYMMNFETTILNESTYDFQQSGTVSEKVFWHWMINKCGLELDSIDGTDGIYREKNYGSGNADRVIQCFGEIDAGNSLSSEFGMYNETYVTVPTSYGNGPVFFRRTDDYEDSNYRLGEYPSGNSMGSEYIQGRSASEYSYLPGDTLRAVYDDDTRRKYVVGDNDRMEIVKDFSTISAALSALANSGITDDSEKEQVIVSSWDDVNIDALEKFKNIDNGSYDMSGICEFKFNAILLYYSLYDLDDEYKQPLATNLFGIVFIDGGDGQYSTGDYLLPPITKKKSFGGGQSGQNAYFGNSYSFRVNIKTLSVYDNTDAYIDDATTSNSIYTQDFNDVVDSLNRAVDMLNFNSHTVNAIQDRYQTMVSVTSDMQETINRMPKEIKADVQEVLDASLSAMEVSLKQYTDDQIDALKERLGIFDDDTDVVVPDDEPQEQRVLGASMVQDMGQFERYVNGMLASMGIIRIDGIIDDSATPYNSGCWLVRNEDGNIYGYIYSDNDNLSDICHCETGKIYSVNGINYQFDGTTCNVIGEKPSKKNNSKK